MGHECLPHLLLRLRRADQGSCALLGGTQPFPDSNPVASAATITAGLPPMVTHLGPFTVWRPLTGSGLHRTDIEIHCATANCDIKRKRSLSWLVARHPGCEFAAGMDRLRRFHNFGCSQQLSDLRSNRRVGRRHQTASRNPGGSGEHVVRRRNSRSPRRSTVTTCQPSHNCQGAGRPASAPACCRVPPAGFRAVTSWMRRASFTFCFSSSLSLSA